MLAGDILFNNTNSAALVGKLAIVTSPMTAGFSNHLTRIRVDRRRVDPVWLSFWIRKIQASGYFTLNATQWVSQAAYRTSDLSKLAIELPSLADQQGTVELLTRADSIVRLRRLAHRKAAELIPAMFIDMFGDPSTNPKGWPTSEFGKVGTLDRGKSRHRPRDAAELYGGPYPFIQTGDVANSAGSITRFSSTYSEAGLAQSRLWPAGTLCITIAANIAKTGVLTFEACFPDSVVGFLPGPIVSTAYVQAWLGFLQPTLEANAPQAAQKNINLEILRGLPIPVPPRQLQEQFESRCASVLSICNQQKGAGDKANAVFNSLLSQAFTKGGTKVQRKIEVALA